MGFATRPMTSMTKPPTVIEKNGYTITIKTHSAFKNTEINFQLGVDFKEVTADVRKVKSVVILVRGKLVHVQKWNGQETMLANVVITWTHEEARFGCSDTDCSFAKWLPFSSAPRCLMFVPSDVCITLWLGFFWTYRTSAWTQFPLCMQFIF